MKVVFRAITTQLAPTNDISPQEFLNSKKYVMEINGTMTEGTIFSSGDLVWWPCEWKNSRVKDVFETKTSQVIWDVQKVEAKRKDVTKFLKIFLHIPFFYCQITPKSQIGTKSEQKSH